MLSSIDLYNKRLLFLPINLPVSKIKTSDNKLNFNWQNFKEFFLGIKNSENKDEDYD